MISLDELKSIVRKAPKEEIWASRLIWRRFSIYITWICAILNIPANLITIISMVAGLVGAVLFCWRVPVTMIVGLLLRHVWNILDHVDGEMARYETKVKHRCQNLGGQYLDVVTHYYIDPPMHFCLGLGLFLQTAQVSYIIIGFIASLGYGGWVWGAALSILLPRFRLSPRLLKTEAARLMLVAGRVNPDHATTSQFEKAMSLAKTLRMYVSYPGNLFIISAAVLADVFTHYYPFGIPFTAWYLGLQALLTLIQSPGGTSYFFKVLKGIRS